jgi:hypothetical protein
MDFVRILTYRRLFLIIGNTPDTGAHPAPGLVLLLLLDLRVKLSSRLYPVRLLRLTDGRGTASWVGSGG